MTCRKAASPWGRCDSSDLMPPDCSVPQGKILRVTTKTHCHQINISEVISVNFLSYMCVEMNNFLILPFFLKKIEVPLFL